MTKELNASCLLHLERLESQGEESFRETHPELCHCLTQGQPEDPSNWVVESNSADCFGHLHRSVVRLANPKLNNVKHKDHGTHG